MGKNGKKDKKCQKKKGLMLFYGFVHMGTRLVSAFALLAIAIGFCAINKQAKVFNDCVEEVREGGMIYSDAVHFCNGGK